MRVNQLIFCVCIIISIGISALYRSVGDAFQLFSDPELIRTEAMDFMDEDGWSLHESMIPIIIYGYANAAAKSIVAYDGQLVGILVNAILVIGSVFLMAGVGDKYEKLSINKSIYFGLSASCGFYLLFSSLHLRDAFALIVVVLMYRILFEETSRSARNLYIDIKLFLKILLISLLFLFIREEFSILPWMLLFIIYSRRSNSFTKIVLLIPVIIICITVLGAEFYNSEVLAQVFDYNRKYRELSFEQSSGGLALFLLYEIPIYLSVFVSSFLVMIVKFPYSANFFNNAYSFYISIAAIQMIYVMPVMATLFYLNYNKINKSIDVSIIFVIYVIILISLTSMQSRHMAILLPLIFYLLSMKGLLTSKKLKVASLIFSNLFFSTSTIYGLIR